MGPYRLNPYLICHCFLLYWEAKLGATSAEFSARAYILLNIDAMGRSIWFMAQYRRSKPGADQLLHSFQMSSDRILRCGPYS